MTNSAKIVNIKLIDLPVDCYYPTFKRDKTLCYEYYSEFLLNDDLYKIGDFAVTNGTEDVEVVRFICIFTTHERKVEAVVRKFRFARNLKDELIEGCTDLDEDNEVVEDFTKDYVIQAEQIIRKCYLVFAHQDETPNIIKKSELDPFLYYFCRYTLRSDGLFPIFSTPQIILCEKNCKSPSVKLDSTKKQIKKIGAENKPLTYLEDFDCDLKSIQDKMKSPKNSHKNIKISECSANISSPIQRNLVKKNLNESFGISPIKTGNSILNYSIVSDEDTDNPLVVKLKVSNKNKTPVVVLKKFHNDSYQVMTLKEKEMQKQVECSPVRKSTRAKERKSYADYISPIKNTPVKRGAIKKISESEETVCFQNELSDKNTSRRRLIRKTDKDIKTPTKSLSKCDGIYQEKKLIRTPKRYQDKIESPFIKKLNLESSVRRSLRLTQTEHPKEVQEVTSPRSSKKNKRQVSISSDKEENNITPKKKVNLDESMRRSMLKVKLNINELNESKALNVSGSTPEDKHKSGATKNFESSSEDEEVSISKTKAKKSTTLISPKTPRTKKVNIADVSEPCAEFIHKTPHTRRRQSTTKSLVTQTPKSSMNQTPKTPRNRAKLIRDGIITPSMQSRSKAVEGDSTPLMKARSQLHVSYVPTALPCREKEYCDVFNFLEGKLLDGCGGCMYISGVPGTGKTATVTSVINNLLDSDDIPKFSYVNVNGMRLTEPRQSYVEIFKQLTGKMVPWEQAQSMLEERFTKSKKFTPVVMLIDELDILCTKRQDVVYNLLDWPTKAKNQLIVITIANTMDLPERLLMNRVTSRLGLTRLTFQAYTHKQLQEIVTKRLSGTNSFNPDAIQFVARKVASVSGDARRALDICRRAAEIAETEGKIQLVNMQHVDEALNAMITQPKVRAIKNCSRLEQLVLQSIVAEVERTGVEETTFADVFTMLVSCSAIDGFRMVSSTNALSAISRLSSCRLILTDQKCSDINQRIILNVSIDDVYYALKRD